MEPLTVKRGCRVTRVSEQMAVANIHRRRWGLGTALHSCLHRSIRVYCLSLRYGTCYDNITSAER